jgi:hypothetical protein
MMFGSRLEMLTHEPATCPHSLGESHQGLDKPYIVVASLGPPSAYNIFKDRYSSDCRRITSTLTARSASSQQVLTSAENSRAFT